MLGALEGRFHVIPRGSCSLASVFTGASVASTRNFRGPRALRTSTQGTCKSSIAVAFAGTGLTPKRALICRILTDFVPCITLTLPEARALPTPQKSARYCCL